MSTITLRALGALLFAPALVAAQRPTLPPAVKQYVAVDTPVVALTHVRVIDGTGAAPKEDQTLIIRDGNIVTLGASRSTRVPDGAQVMDLTGKSVIPGLVMMHEHLYYPTGPGVYGAEYVSFSRLYLAAAVDEAHRRGLKITGHLCSVTYREAADLGIDDLEHGFFVATDFIQGKQPDVCPAPTGGMPALVGFDAKSPEFTSLVQHLISHHVAVTSTLTVFETVTPGQPVPPGTDVLDPLLKTQYGEFNTRVQQNTASPFAKLFALDQAMELAFFRAGGLLLAGTDPTGGGGVIPGYSDQREVELLVASGLTPLEAIKVCTLNGATYLGRADRVGSIAVGKQADLVVIDGNPAATISDIRHVTVVFKEGVGDDPAKLVESVGGEVGLF